MQNHELVKPGDRLLRRTLVSQLLKDRWHLRLSNTRLILFILIHILSPDFFSWGYARLHE